MPPFQYRTFQDPYVGDITRLMGAGPEAQARSIREIGNIRAQEAQQKGAITAGLVGNLSDIGQSAYGTYRQNKIDKLVAEVANRINPAALTYVGEDRVRPMDWNALSPAMMDTPVPQDRPPGKKAYTPPSADTPLPMPDRETEPFSGQLGETIGPYAAGFLRDVLPDASVEEPDEVLRPEKHSRLTSEGIPVFRANREAKLLTEKEVPVPETMGEVLATPAPSIPPYRGEKPSLWLNKTAEGVFDIGAIAEQLQREGLTRAEIDPEMARLNEYNTAQIALNNREKELGLDARTLRVDRSLGSLFVQNPNPSFNEILVAVEGDTEQALDIQKTMAEGQKAILDISNGQVENLIPKVQAMLALIDVFPALSSKQAALDLAKGELVASGQVPKELLPLFDQLQTPDDFRRFVGNLAAQEDQGTLDQQIAQKIAERQYAQSIGNTETVNQLDAQIAELKAERESLWRPYASSGGRGGGVSALSDEAFAERVAALGIPPIEVGKNMYETLQGFSGFLQSTGMPATLARTARSTFLIGDVMAGIPGFGTWGDRALEIDNQFRLAESEIMRRVVKNPRFPVAEQERVLAAMGLSFGPLTSRAGPTAGLIELTRTLRQIQQDKLAMRDIDAAEDINRLLDYLGVPDHVASGEPAPIPVSSWEADGERLFYDKDGNLIDHLTEALE